MIRALAIETSARTGSIAAAEDGVVIAEQQFEHGLQNAAQILPIIDRLCRGQSWSPGQIDHLYVSAGPGSFTGLRIGITLAKTLSLSTGCRLVAVPSVRVLVENATPQARHVAIVLDAKRDQIFTALFERGASGWIEREPAHLDALTAVVARSPRPVHLLGEGIPYHQKFLSGDADVIVTAPELWRPQARVVAALGTTMAAAGEFVEADRLTPIYIRRPEAEEKFEAAQAARRGGGESINPGT